MVYKKPKMLLLELEEEDIVTLSNDGHFGGDSSGGDGSDEDLWGDDDW